VISTGVQELTRRSGWLLLALCLAFSGCSIQDSGQTRGPARPAPDFTLPDVHGTEFSLSDYRGKTVVIDFWATWCLPCLYQIPVLNELWDSHRDSGAIAVVGVAVDVEGAEVVAPWIEEQGVEYQILIGDEGLAREFGAMGFPTIAIVSPDGDIESLHAGVIDLEGLEELILPPAS
jgi:peroxiredoxin